MGGTRIPRYTARAPSYVRYHDRPSLIDSTYHYDYTYRDYGGLLRTRLVWPSYYVPLYYSCGPWFTFRYVYPYYLRKYIFVSLGGYWPFDYCYLRYYWYGCHPYYWYGYYPMASEVEGPTYNYYTYNYYTGDEAAAQSQVVDPSLFNKLGEQPEQPAGVTLADVYFEDGVKAFGRGDYDTAAKEFSRAMELAPDDMILPFARSQALLAAGQYSQAAVVLREALAKVTPDKEGVFYPRGLYAKQDTLLAQIDLLGKQAESYSFDPDLQLLLGYQLLGIGQTDEAVEPLMNASKDLVNADAAKVLLNLAQKIETENSQAKPKDKGTPSTPAAPPIPKKENPAPTSKDAILEGRTIGLKKTMFLTSLLAVATGAAIRRFARC
jgi:Tetratricopeptide repeat